MGIRIKKDLPLFTFMSVDVNKMDALLLMGSFLLYAPSFLVTMSLPSRALLFFAMQGPIWGLILWIKAMPEGNLQRFLRWHFHKKKHRLRYYSETPPARSPSEALLIATKAIKAHYGLSVPLPREDKGLLKNR